MPWVQQLSPNTGVSCIPGWCLKYVSDAFGVSNIPHTNYPTATDAWNASEQHRDYDFPANCYVPIWFSLRDVAAGHVAIMCPDGSVFSSSDPNTNVPHHHPSLNALIAYYANANPLTFLGWSSDIGGTPVIRWIVESTTTSSQGGDMPEVANLDTARILTHGILARNGLAGRQTTLGGAFDADLNANHVGRPLTNAYVQELFLSAEGRRWRDSNDPDSINGINARLTQADADKATVASQATDLATARKTIDDQAAQFKGLQDKSAGLAKNLDDSQLELKDAKDQLTQAESIASDDDAKIKDLTAKLSSAQAQIDQLKAEAADKPPAHLTNTSTPTPQKDSTQHQNLLSNLLDALVSFIRGAK